MLSCQLRYVAVSWPWCVPLCTCCSWISWHMVAQHVLDTASLALGCPTLRSGTWLPNAHGCLPCVSVYSALHIIWSPSTSFILTVILCDIYYYSAAPCDVLWTFSTSTWSSWIVYICLHERCYCMDISLLAHLYIPIYPRSMTLQYYHSRSSRRFTVFSVLPRCVEPFLISWLSGHYVMLWSPSWMLCAYLHSSIVLLMSMHSCDFVCLTWNVITMSCRPCILQSMISVTNLLYCYPVGAAFLISMDILLVIWW